MVDQRDQTIEFIKANGPVLPVQIAKALSTSIIFGSAILSELVARKILKITLASIGGSPVYYLPGQEALMDERLSKSLGGREKQAYDFLKERKVVREKDLEPWQRVAIKSLRDFAVALQVNAHGIVDIFWKHSLVLDEEAKEIIAPILKELYEEVPQREEISEKVSLVQQNSFQPQAPVLHHEVEEEIYEPEALAPLYLEPEIIPQEKRLEEKNITLQAKNEFQEKLYTDVVSVKVKQEIKPEGKFYDSLLAFLHKNGAEILKEEVLKKDKEIDFLVNIFTNFGKLRYLIKAKNKPLINEADVSLAFGEGQLKKLPVILLVNGKINKKAIFLAEQKMQGQLILKEL